MATTKSKKRNVSFFSVLTLIMSILPIVIEFINRGEPNAQIDLTFDDNSQRLRAKVTSSDVNGSVSKSALNAKH